MMIISSHDCCGLVLESEKEFFGPIDATHKEISKNSHFTRSSSSQQSSLESA